MKPTLTEHILEWCQANIPAQYLVDALTETSPDVPVGTIKIRCLIHGPNQPPTVAAPYSPVGKAWRDGERDAETTRPLYAEGLVEPYVAWAGDLSWRVTEAGKKAGLK